MDANVRATNHPVPWVEYHKLTGIMGVTNVCSIFHIPYVVFVDDMMCRETTRCVARCRDVL